MEKIIVIGGGAAGMAAAVSASRQGCSAIIYERNEKLGKKLFITGKGRCNLTNAADMKTVMDSVVTNPRFLYSSFRELDNTGVMELMEGSGCPVKVERGQRVFPVSDKSRDVISAWERLLKESGARVRLNTRVTGLIIEDGQCRGIKVGGEEIRADAVILATGGLSYKTTGSTGDGHRWASFSGHDMVPCLPSLVPLKVKESASCRAMMGLSLRNVTVSLWNEDKAVFREFGEMLFTHFGVSGPVILSASAAAGRLIAEKELKLTIDLKPALSEDELDSRLLKDFSKYINKDFRNALGDLLPSGLIPEVLKQSEIDPYKKVNEVTRAERSRLLKVLKGLAFTVTGTADYNEAIVTKGGISVKDIDPKTMESRKVRGLYIAGEIIDVDAYTGGFNLQIAWSTGWNAGSHAAQAVMQM